MCELDLPQIYLISVKSAGLNKFLEMNMLDVVNASNNSLWLPYPVLVYICYAL